jgi:hypothetical protein
MLEEQTTLLGLQEADLEVREAILVEEREHSLHPPNGWDLPVELEKVHARVDQIGDDHATEAERLSQQVAQVVGVLIVLGLLPIEDIP